MPISTVPLPIGITSPPSSEASPKSAVSKPAVGAFGRVPELEVGRGEHRVGAVDGGDVVGLAPAGRPVHRVDRHAAVDPARRVTGEQRVRQRREHELARVVERRADQRDLGDGGRIEARLGDGQAADEMRGEDRRAPARPARLADLVDERPTDRVLRGDQLDEPQPGLVARGERLGEQIRQQEAPRRRVRACARRTGRARTGRARPTARRRTAGRRGSTGSTAAGSGPVGGPSPCAACRPPNGRRARPSSSLPGRRAGATRRAGLPATIAVDVGQRADRGRACRWPRRSGRPPRPSDPSSRRRTSRLRSSAGVTRSRRRCSGVPQPSYTPSTSVAMTNRSASTSRASSSLARSLSITASTPPSVRSWPGTHVVGIPPPPAQMTTVPCSSSQRIGRISKIRFGAGDGTTRRSRSPSRLNTQPFSAARAAAASSS